MFLFLFHGTDLNADHWWYVNSLSIVEDPAGSGEYRIDYTFTVNFRTVKRFYWELYVVESGCNATDGFTESFSGCTLQGNLPDGNHSGTLASGILLCPGKSYDAIMFTRRRGDCLSDNTNGSGGSNTPNCGTGCGDMSCGCPEDRASAATPLGLLTKFPGIASGDPANIWAGTPLNSLGDTPSFDGNWAYIRTTLEGNGLPDYNFSVDIEVDDCFGNFNQSFSANQDDGQVVFENFGGMTAQVRCGAPVSLVYNASNSCGTGYPGNTFEVIDNSTIGGSNIGSGSVNSPMGPGMNVDGRFEELNGAISVGNICMDGVIDLNLINSTCSAEEVTDVTVQYDIEVLYPTSNFADPSRVNCSDVCGQNLILSSGAQWTSAGLNMGGATTLPVTDDADGIYSFEWSGQVCTPSLSADACNSGSGSALVDNCAACGIYDITYSIVNDSCATCNTTTTKQIEIVSPVITNTTANIIDCGPINPAISFDVVECNPSNGAPTATPYTGLGDRFWQRSDMPSVFLPFNSPGIVAAGETVTFTPHWRYSGCASCNAVGSPITVTSLGILEVTCPINNDLGNFDCSNLSTIPAPPNSEASAEAAPYNMTIGNDPCGTIIVTSSDDQVPDPCTGVGQMIIRTVSVIDDEDGSGTLTGSEQSFSCQFIINILPAFVSPALVGMPGDISITCDTPPMPTTLNFTNGGINDCLSMGSVTSTLTAYPGICGGPMTETWTIPSSANCNQGDIISSRIITILPPSTPTISCPSDEVVECLNDIVAGSPVINTSCGAMSSFSTSGPTLVSGTADCPGAQYEIEYTVTDECGTMASCTQTFTIANNPPMISCPANKIVTCEDDIASEIAMVTSSCGLGTSVTTSGIQLTSGTADCNGATYEIEYTVEDDCGRMASCVQVFTISNSGPIITSCAPDIVVVCMDDISANIPAINYTTSCGLTATVSAGPIVPNASNSICGELDGDSYQITYTVEDECGRQSTCTQTFTIDSSSPNIMCAEDILIIGCDVSDAPAPDPSLLFGSDGCGMVSIDFISDVPSGGGCPGDTLVISRTYRVTNGCGVTSDCIQLIKIIDTIPPDLNIDMPAVTVSCDMAPPLPVVTTTDNCSSSANISISFKQDTTSMTCPGDLMIVRTWIATDECGNQDSAKQNIIVIDVANPTFINGPPDTVISCIDPIPAAMPPSFDDNCSMPSIAFSEITSAGSCPGEMIITRTWSATDSCNNMVEVEQTITIEDKVPPTIICPADVILTGCSVGDAPPVDLGAVTASDLCSNVIISHEGDTQFGQGCIGDTLIITRTYRATDECGNFSECQQLIKIVDDVAPVITVCPSGSIIDCIANIPTPNPGAVIATDNCGTVNAATVLSITDNGGAGCSSDPYELTYTYQVTDPCGNATTCTQVYTVIDNQDPMITYTPPGNSFQCISEIPSPDPGALIVTDNCDITNPVIVLDTTLSGSGCASDPYILVYTYQVSDACGNTASSTQTFTVIDNIPPTITSCPADSTVQCVSEIPAAQPSLVTAVDNCGDVMPATLLSTIDNGGLGCSSSPYVLTYTYQITDACGNATTCVQEFTVIDDTAPIITSCPADGTAQCISDIPAADPGSVVATDNCGSTNAATVISTTNNGGMGCAGSAYVLTYTYEITDDCGNATTCEQQFTVIDNIPPVITNCPADITVQCIADIPVANPGAVTATDNCGITNAATLLVTNNNGGMGCSDDPYILTYTYEITDNCGNSSTCIQTITVIDDTTPVITSCPSDGTVKCIADIPPPDPASVVASDNCAVVNMATLISTTDNGGMGCMNDPFVLTYQYEITDACGNADTCEQSFTVIDDVPPTIMFCPPGDFFQCIADIPPATPASVVAVDNCGMVIPATLLSTTDNGGTGCPGDPYILTYTYEVADPCGNTTTCTQIHTVIDDTPPVITFCPEGGQVHCITEIPAADPAAVMATDNCGVVNMATLLSTVDVSNSGCALDTFVRTYTYQVTDACGNTTTCEQKWYVVDNLSPAITSCPGDTTVQCMADIPAARPEDVIGTDNCGSVNMATLLSTSDNGGAGCPNSPFILTYTYELTDPCGNSTTCSQNITVVDDTAPVNTCPPDLVIIGCDVSAAPPPDISTVMSSDNCQGSVVTHVGDVVMGDGCPGDTLIIERTYRTTDHCGSSTDCIQIIKIVDDVPPMFSGVSDMTVSCDEDIYNLFSAWLTDIAGGMASDVCSGVSFTTIPANPSLNPTSSTCVVFIASDDCGNQTPLSACFNVDCSSITKTYVENLDQDGSLDISAGDELVYSIVFTNEGSTVLTNVEVTDNLITPNSEICPSLEPGASCTLSGSYIVTPGDVVNGLIENIATAFSDQIPPISDTLDLPVPTPNLTITKNPAALLNDLDGSGDMSVGDIVEYEIVAVNNGTANLTNIQISDPLLSPTSATCSLLLPSETCTLTGTYQITSIDLANGFISNVAVVDSDQTDPEDDNSSTNLPTPNMSIIKGQPVNADNDSSGDISIGDILTYTITVTNTGDATLTNVEIMDNTITQVSGSSPCAILAPMESCTFIGTYEITSSDVSGMTINEITNIATATSDQSGEVADSTTIQVPNPSMEINKSPGLLTGDFDNSGDISAGDELTFTIIITNNGNANLTGVSIDDPFLDPNSIDCGTLMMGESCELVGSYLVTPADILNGSFQNISTGSSVQPPIMISDTAEVFLPQPAHSMSKLTPTLLEDNDGSLDVSAGDVLEYTIIVSNTGTANLTDVLISDPLLTPMSILCPIIEPGQNCTLVGTYLIGESDLGGSLINTASSISDQTPGQMDMSEIIVPEPELSIEKSAAQLLNDNDGNALMSTGDEIQFIITATNIGSANLTNVVIEDVTIDPSSVICSLLMPLESCELVGTYILTQADMDNGMFENIASALSDQTDEITDDVITTLPFVPELNVEKNLTDISLNLGVNDDLIDPDDVISYEYVVTNSGLVTMTDIEINDSGPTFNGIPGTNMLTSIICDQTTLLPGESTICRAMYTISQEDFDNAVGIIDAIENEASTSGIDPRGDVFNSMEDDASGTIPENASIELLKIASPISDYNGDGILWVGDLITYTFTVTNTGNTHIDDIEVLDDNLIEPIICSTSSLAPGESMTCTAEYFLTEEDGEEGQVVNSATVEGISQTGTSVSDVSDDPSDPTTRTMDPTIVEIPCPSIACPGQINLALSATEPYEITPQVVGLPSGFVIHLIDSNGDTIPGNLIDCSFSNINVTFTANHPCRPAACWGTIKIESKQAPETITNHYTYWCGEEFPNLDSEDEIINSIYSAGCYGKIDNIRENFEELGDDCLGKRTIRKVEANLISDGTKLDITLQVDTLDQMPLSLDSVQCPKSGQYDEALTFVCRQSQFFEDLSPENVFILTQEDVTKTYPYIDTGREIEFFDTITFIDRIEERQVDTMLLINDLWVNTSVVIKDTVYTNRIVRDFRKVYIPLLPGKICNLSISYKDSFFEGCLGPETKLLRTWNILDWCTGEIVQCEQWIIIIDDTPPTISPINDIYVSIAPWTCLANVELPAPYIEDDCTGFEYSWESSAGRIEDNFIHELSLDDTPVTVKLKSQDNCGNQKEIDFLVHVVDSIRPVAIARDELNVTLVKDPVSLKGIAKVYADDINLNSHDVGCDTILSCILLDEELNHPIIRDGIHLHDEFGNPMYEPFSCEWDGVYEYHYVDNKQEVIEEIPYVICKEFVKFCCSDLGTKKVALIVSDNSAYSKDAISWSNVTIEDKSLSSVSCEQKFVNCDQSIHPDDIGYPNLTQAVCELSELTYLDEGDLDNCGRGTIIRTWYAGSEIMCSEQIIFEQSSGLDPYTIKWPSHYNSEIEVGVVRECEELILINGEQESRIVEYQRSVSMYDYFECNDQNETGEPYWCTASCNLVAATYEPLEVATDDACKKIIKQWTIIDWCIWDPDSTDPDSDDDTFQAVDDTWLDIIDETKAGKWESSYLEGSENSQLTESGGRVTDLECSICDHSQNSAQNVYFRYKDVQRDGYYRFDQIIKVVDKTSPDIVAEDEVIVEIFTGADSKDDSYADCQNSIDVIATVNDLCNGQSPEYSTLTWTVSLLDSTSQLISEPLIIYGDTAQVSSGLSSAGDVRYILWEVEDGCNNSSVKTTKISFIDSKRPTPICIETLSTHLMSSDGTVTIWASDFDRGSFDNCGNVSFYFKGEQGQHVPSLTFSCSDLINDGLQNLDIELYVIDESGNEDFCNVQLSIIDDSNICVNSDSNGVAAIGGKIMTINNEPLQAVTLQLSERDIANSNNLGLYAFYNLPMYQDYDILASREHNYKEGITVSDLVLIQRHILQQQEISSSYNLIAADVNGDQKISVLDIVELRRLLLGYTSQFISSPSWRFLPDQKMKDVPHVWPFMENLSLINLSENRMFENLTGVKIGDVNGSFIENLKNLNQEFHNLEFIADKNDVKKGDHIFVRFRSKETTDIAGMQFTLGVKGLRHLSSSSGAIQITGDNWGYPDAEHITCVWHGDQMNQKRNELFTLHFEVLADGLLEDMIQLNSDITQAMIYSYTGLEKDLISSWKIEHSSEESIFLMQNEPNPFNEMTTVSFFLPQSGEVELSFFDITGTLVHSTVAIFDRGHHSMTVQKSDLKQSGVFYYQLSFGSQVKRKKMILIQ